MASYSNELEVKETKQIDESIESLANDLITKIEDQEFDDSDSDDDENTGNQTGNFKPEIENKTRNTTGSFINTTGNKSVAAAIATPNKSPIKPSKTPTSGGEMEEDLDFQLQLSEDEEELGNLVEENLFEAPAEDDTVRSLFA